MDFGVNIRWGMVEDDCITSFSLRRARMFFGGFTHLSPQHHPFCSGISVVCCSFRSSLQTVGKNLDYFARHDAYYVPFLTMKVTYIVFPFFLILHHIFLSFSLGVFQFIYLFFYILFTSDFYLLQQGRGFELGNTLLMCDFSLCRTFVIFTLCSLLHKLFYEIPLDFVFHLSS